VSRPESCKRRSAPYAVPVPQEIAAPVSNDKLSGKGTRVSLSPLFGVEVSPLFGLHSRHYGRLNRLPTQIQRILDEQVTKAVVEAARESLVIGQA
jgi:hypothetical protein